MRLISSGPRGNGSVATRSRVASKRPPVPDVACNSTGGKADDHSRADAGLRLTRRWSGISWPGSGGTSGAAARNALRSSGEAFPARRLNPPFKEVSRRLDGADLLRDRGCNPLVQPYLVFPARRAAAALIEAGSFRGTDELMVDAAVRGRADALLTCNLGHFAQGRLDFACGWLDPQPRRRSLRSRKPLECTKSYAWHQIRKATSDRSAVVRFRSQQRRSMPQKRPSSPLRVG